MNARDTRRRCGPLSAAIAVLATLAVACGSAGQGGSPNQSEGRPAAAPAPSPTSGLPGATTFAEFRAAFCDAWGSIFRAYGNPDTAAKSDLFQAFEAAVQSGDEATITAAAEEVLAELERARDAAVAGGAWPPAAAGMADLERIVAGFQAMVEARRSAAASGPDGAAAAGQAAFEAAGALEAWQSVLTPETWAAVNAARPADEPYRNCGDLPIGM